jgi:PAS domain S-box-containing protein
LLTEKNVFFILPVPHNEHFMDTQNSFDPTSLLSSEQTIAIEAELTRLLYAQASVGFLATLINVAILTAALWSILPATKLLAWCATMLVITGVRFFFVRRHRQLIPTIDQEARWRMLYILGTASIGIVWGSLCLFVFPTDLSHQVFVAFVFAGMSAGAVTILSSVPSAALSFFLPVLAPMTLQFFRQGDDLSVAMGTMILVFLGTLLFAVRHLHATTVETLQLRFSQFHLEGSLRTSEVRYRDLFENANDGIATFTLDGVLTSINRGLEHMVGWSREEMIGHPHGEFATAASSALASERTRRAIVGDNLPSLFELELLHKQGTVVPVEARARLVRDQNGAVTGVQAVFRDITDRKRAEEELRKAHEELEQRVQERTAELHGANQQLVAEVAERQRAEEALSRNEAYFRALIEDGSDLISILQTDGTIAYASPSHQRLLGYDPEELRGRNAFSFIHPDEIGAVVASFTLELQTPGVGKSVEFRFRHKDGSWRVLESAGNNLSDTPAIAGVIVNSRDITDRKIAEETIKKNEERFRALVENSTDVVMILNTDLTIRYRSPTASGRGIHGYTVDTLIGRNALEFIHPDDRQKLHEVFFTEVLARSGVTQLPPFRALHSDGSWRMMEATLNNLLDHPVIAGIIYTGRDITERQHVEKEKESLQAQLLQAQKLQSIGTLAGGIAHDFNNLLTPIIGFSELLKRTVTPKTRAWRNLQEILKASHNAKDLVQQMLAFSLPSQQSRAPVPLNALLKDCLGLLRAGLPPTIEIRAVFDPRNGAALANPTQLHQVLMNLGINALQAMEGQDGVLDISVAQETVAETFAALHPPLTPGPYCTLTVRDTGDGISLEVQARIFDPFFTTKEVGKGSGLGLSVVHGIVSSHGGVILVDSAPGKGSTFTVYLPRCDASVTLATEAPASLARGYGCILFVDDEQSVSLLARQMLIELGYEVVSVADSREALTLFRQEPHRFDALLTDEIMPNLKGTELALAVRSLRSELPIIVCSGSDFIMPMELAQAQTNTAYLKKPFTIDQLGEALQQVLHSKEEVQL